MKKIHDVTLWQLFVSFFKIGALTYGGGYAMLPMLMREVIDKHHWATEEEVLDIYAIGQVTPGIIAVNTATMIGYRKRGVLGALAATFGEVAPSLIIITMLAAILNEVRDSLLIQRAFSGIRVAVCALITQSVINLAKKSLIDLPTVILFMATVVATMVFSLSPIWVVVCAILSGLVLKQIKRESL